MTTATSSSIAKKPVNHTRLIAIIISIVVICGLVFVGISRHQSAKLNAERIGSLNRMRQMSFARNYQEILNVYATFATQFPEHASQVHKIVYEAYLGVAEELSNKGSKTRQDYQKIIEYVNNARELDAIGTLPLQMLCDAYINLEQYDKAMAILAEAQQRGDSVNRRFNTYRLQLSARGIGPKVDMLSPTDAAADAAEVTEPAQP